MGVWMWIWIWVLSDSFGVFGNGVILGWGSDNLFWGVIKRKERKNYFGLMKD